VPSDGSDALRRLVEALFITHTEAQLNTDGHLDKLLFPPDMMMIMTTNQNHKSSEQVAWCKGLVRR